uniref:Vacuolar protein sorting-associated protein VTA1 n=1 Tax=Panagrellus redivivus TaxID=6233 RepID=A0A7E4VE28_PANRE
MADLPPSLRPVAHYVKIANEYASRDPVIQYWALYYAVQAGMKLDKSSPEAVKFLGDTLGHLEVLKKANPEKDAIKSDIVAQAHIEEHALKLFHYADENDRAANFSKNVVKTFYTAGHLMDILQTFGELNEEIASAKKYAKWKATYIHNCLKNGETPVPGPPGGLQDQAQPPTPSAGPPSGGPLGAPPAPFNPNDFGLPTPGQQLGGGYSSDSSAHGQQYHQQQQPQQPQWPQQPPAQGGYGGPQQPQGGHPGYGFSAPAPQHQPTSHEHHPIPPPRPSLQAGGGSSASFGPPAGSGASAPGTGSIPTSVAPAPGLKLEDFIDARKFAKYAVSALDYEDAPTAIENLIKALQILQRQ